MATSRLTGAEEVLGTAWRLKMFRAAGPDNLWSQGEGNRLTKARQPGSRFATGWFTGEFSYAYARP